MSELPLVLAVQTWFTSSWGQVLAVFAARWLLFVMAAGVVVLYGCGLWRKRDDLRRSAVLAARSGVLALIMASILGRIIGRMRPFRVSSAVHLLVPPPGTYYSFPSIHASLAFAFAASLAFAGPRMRILAAASAVLVALGRVAVGVHYPTDVIAGALLGVLCGLAARYNHRRHV